MDSWANGAGSRWVNPGHTLDRAGDADAPLQRPNCGIFYFGYIPTCYPSRSFLSTRLNDSKLPVGDFTNSFRASMDSELIPKNKFSLHGADQQVSTRPRSVSAGMFWSGNPSHPITIILLVIPEGLCGALGRPPARRGGPLGVALRGASFHALVPAFRR